jgi:hypothetical protein
MRTRVPHAAPTLQMITPSDHACHVSIGSCPTVSANNHAAKTPAANSSQIMAYTYSTEAAFG